MRYESYPAKLAKQNPELLSLRSAKPGRPTPQGLADWRAEMAARTAAHQQAVAERLAKQDYSPMQALAMRSLKGGVCV